MIPDEDLKTELLRDPPGGQHVGTGRSGVRITHIPTGIVAEVEYSRSQHKNREIALDMIAAALTNPHFR